MTKLFIEDLDLKGKRVLMRVDYNVPLDSDLEITDSTRIDATLPSIRYILEKGASLVLMSHLGRPGNEVDPELSLKPCAEFLSKTLGKEVPLAPDCVGEKVRVMVSQLQPGQILMLENLRFHRAEEHPDEDPEFAAELARFGDVFINDAFAAAHRKHSSTYTIARYFPGRAAAGFLLAKEVQFLKSALVEPARPFCAIIGGSKISTKIGVLKALAKRVDFLLIGGAMSLTLLKAMGKNIGKSLCEEAFCATGLDLLSSAKEKLVLPVDIVTAKEMSEEAKTTVVSVDGIGEADYGLDIGPKTIQLFREKIAQAKTIFWNGPMGVFELEAFASGTNAIAEAIAGSTGTTIVAGGETIAAVHALDLQSKITHISTGGGASLEFIEFGTLPGVEALSDK